MEHGEIECLNPNLGEEIAYICETEDVQQVAEYFCRAEPNWLENLELHPECCDYCSDHYPAVGERIDAVQTILRKKALLEIESLHKRFVVEFSVQISQHEEPNRHFADVIAALASVYAAPVLWQLYILQSEYYWKDVTPMLGIGSSQDLIDIQEFAEHIKELPLEVLHFLFKVLIAREIFRALCQVFERMQHPSIIRTKPEGLGFEVLDNPDYPIYQVYLLEVSDSDQEGDESEIQAPLYGSAKSLNFIRQMLHDKLLESPADYSLLYYSIDIAAERFLGDFLERNGVASEDLKSSAKQPFASFNQRKLNDIHQDLSDAADSIKAGQMEILRELQICKGAKEYLPLVASRLGNVFPMLHAETQRLLARGEYFLAINQAEPDAMQPVVLDQAKACEHELLSRVFWPYIQKLFEEGVSEYPAHIPTNLPLIKYSKICRKSMTLGTYCWYLREDLHLRSWAKTVLHLDASLLEREAGWISERRNEAAHKADFRQYDAAIFQSRVYGHQGLLASLHSVGE